MWRFRGQGGGALELENDRKPECHRSSSWLGGPGHFKEASVLSYKTRDFL